MDIVLTADLNTHILYSENFIKFYKLWYGLDVLGLDGDQNLIDANSKENLTERSIFYLSSEFAKDDCFLQSSLSGSLFTGNIDENFYMVDILTIKTSNNIKYLLKKYSSKNLGIEFLISDIKYYDNNSLGKWFSNMKWVYKLCKKYNSQFILSSGASRYNELLSLKVINILLEKIGIQKEQYWQELGTWLNIKQSVFSYYDRSKKKV